MARYPGRVARFYVTTPIYYVNDAPHIGHAYTTLTADALARWHRLLGDDVFFLTGTDEHGLKVKRSAEANGLTPQEQADIYSARFRDAWELLDISNDDFIRTTEPRHHQAVKALMQAAYDNGWITLGTYEGLYCVACEAYYTEADLVNGLCPVHHRPVELLKEDNYFFRLSAFSDRLLEWYAANPGAVTPEAKRNEALGLIKGRPAGHFRHPHLTRLGRAGAMGRRARVLRLVRRPHQLRHRGRLRRGHGPVREMVAGGPPPDRQGHTALSLRLLAGFVHGGRHRAPAPHRGPRVFAGGRGENVQDRVQPDIARPTWCPTSGWTASGTISCATSSSAPTATSPTRRWSPATTPTWPTTWATCWPG